MIPGASMAEVVSAIGGVAGAFGVVITAVTLIMGKRFEAQKLRLDKQELDANRRDNAITALDTVITSLRRELEETQADLVTARTDYVEAVTRMTDQEREARGIQEQNRDIQKQLELARDRVERHSQSIVNLDTRLTIALRIRDTALHHIHEREMWALRRWPDRRPETLPEIPDELIPEIEKLVTAHHLRARLEPPYPMPDLGGGGTTTDD